jgi:hypothetical protein
VASPVAWCPVSLVPYRNGRVGVYPHIVDRGKPGLIAVLANGKRFVNEADGYHDLRVAMVRAVPAGQEVASWLVCDHAFQRRYPFGMSKPFPVPVWPYVRSGYLKRSRTIAGWRVAAASTRPGCASRSRSSTGTPRRRGPGVRPRHHAVQPGFRRSGPPAQPVARPDRKPPYYAIKVLPGSFGTFAGLKTDPRSRVLERGRRPIPGLYAVGCDQANVMGGHYPSGGINIGPAMTFGYIAGRDAAGCHRVRELVPAARNDGI